MYHMIHIDIAYSPESCRANLGYLDGRTGQFMYQKGTLNSPVRRHSKLQCQSVTPNLVEDGRIKVQPNPYTLSEAEGTRG